MNSAILTSLVAAAFRPSSAAFRPSFASSQLLPRAALPLVRCAEGEAITITEPTFERARKMDITRPNWRFEVIGASVFKGIGVLGDSVGEIAPSSEREIRESLPAGCTRYVFAGQGTLSSGSGKPVKIGMNTLVKINQDAELLWTRANGCEHLVLASPEYDAPERRLARKVLPTLVGVLGGVGILAVASEALNGNL